MAQAGERSKKYDWAGAADCYKQAIENLAPDANPLERGHHIELLAISLFKNAFQAGDRDEFKNRMRLAEESYKKALALYEKASSEALSKLYQARRLFAAFWTSEDDAEKSNLLRESISLAQQAAKIFETQRDKRTLTEAYRDLLAYSLKLCELTLDSKVVKEQLEIAWPITERNINESDDLVDRETLVECLVQAVGLIDWYSVLVQSRHEVQRRGTEAARRAGEISEETGTPYALCLAKYAAGEAVFYAEEDAAKAPEEALKLFKEAVTAAESTNDSYVLGFTFGAATHAAYWAALSSEDTDQKRELLEEGIRFGQRAAKNAEITLHGVHVDDAYSYWAGCHTLLGQYVETEPEKKREHFWKAIEIARKGMSYQKRGAPWTSCRHELTKSIYFLARIETDPQKRSQLLNEALPIREEVVQVMKLLNPKSWLLGVYYNYLALIKAELSALSTDPRTRIELLGGAVSTMQQCVDICTEFATTAPFLTGAVAQYNEWYGDILVQLFYMTRNIDVAGQALKAYEDTVACFIKSELIGPTAAVRWKIARIHDTTGNYKKASQAFNDAARDYGLAAKKIPGLSSTHGELASYMEAWSRIEEARLDHDEEHYLQAAENYAKAASILEGTRTWKELSTHYDSCSLLEKGEALSREEKQEASVEAFSSAAKGFKNAAAKLEGRLRNGPETSDKQELKQWLDITRGRERYAQGRIELEEARVLDKKGEEEESSRKYGSAHETFNRLLWDAPNEQSRREMETLALFCKAWGKMKQAEVETSPQLYTEAGASFLKAKDSTTRKKFRLLALANASMCKALEAGTMFRRTRDIALYSDIKRQLESAADHYEQAGFKNATDWTRATQTMFDALAYMASAEVELEPKKKTEFYRLAEKHLELAAKLYGEAGFQSKGDEALRHLRRVRQQREILLTPAEVLAENPAVSGAVVAPVSLIRDQAVGLEKYEGAQVVGNLNVYQKDLGVGSDLTVELEMANVGKTAAMLIKLENVAPKGFELDRDRIPHRIEDNYIDMKGKRLEYLKTHEVKVPMRALTKGTFEIRPRIFFVDEKGTYRSYDFEPAALTVKELGISGWLKGPKTK